MNGLGLGQLRAKWSGLPQLKHPVDEDGEDDELVGPEVTEDEGLFWTRTLAPKRWFTALESFACLAGIQLPSLC